MPLPKIGILFGGASEEHAVSVKSAREVSRSLDPAKYDPVWIEISRAGAWRLVTAPGETGSHRQPVLLSPDPDVHGLLIPGAGGCQPLRLDAVLPVLHGRHGEDGTIQGLLELSGIPYAGCRVQTSAVCMDKSLTYAVAATVGVAVPAFHTVHAGEPVDPAMFRYPVFVKPARSGSSFGVTRVETGQELSAAVTDARRFDHKILVEEAVAGREIGCAFLGTGAEAVAGALDRVDLSSGFFRIHQEETPETGSANPTIIVPADITAREECRVRAAAARIYHALGCTGLARVDMFLTDSGDVILNEVNTLPGLTSYSRYPQMMAAAGITLADVVDRLLSAVLAENPR